MAQISSRAESLARSARILPISDEPNPSDEHITNTIAPMSVDGGGGGDGFSGEHDPHDAWLPITESRNGSSFSATFHLLSSGIGIQVLSLPLAFVSLGWFWGILSLSVLFSWQLYTIWLLVNLHESAPVTGIRYSRFMHLSKAAFGEKIGKLVALFPTMYLSGGSCVMYIIAGGAATERLFETMCDGNIECRAKTLTGAEWFLIFICIAILTSLFFPNLNSLAFVSFIGSVTAIAYCSLLWILCVTKGRPHGHVETQFVPTGGDASQIRKAFTGFELVALAFRGHNLVLEIQATLPTNRNHQSRKSMWRGVVISYLLIAMCMYPLAIAGYWAYGDKIPQVGGFLAAFTKFHQNITSKYLIGAIYILIIINYLCGFQIYALPIFDNLDHLYVAKKNGSCPRWVRSGIKIFYGGMTYFISVAFPFLPTLATLIGAVALPLTFVDPCYMWIAIKKPRRFSRMWCVNMGLGSSGVVLSIVWFSVAIWVLVVDGLEANFFKPK